MRAGELDRDIELQRRVDSVSSSGEPEATWETISVEYASASWVQGSERFAASQALAEVDVEFRIRWRDGVSPVLRVLFQGTQYDILVVKEIGRREGLSLYAKARAEALAEG